MKQNGAHELPIHAWYFAQYHALQIHICLVGQQGTIFTPTRREWLATKGLGVILELQVWPQSYMRLSTRLIQMLYQEPVTRLTGGVVLNWGFAPPTLVCPAPFLGEKTN